MIRNIRSILMLLSISFSLLACGSEPSNSQFSVSQIEGKEAVELSKESNTVILDVRTGWEYNSSRIPGAVHLSIHSNSFVDSIKTLDRSKTYLVYCGAGPRSNKAATLMLKEGFEEVYNLKGGIMRWKGPVQE